MSGGNGYDLAHLLGGGVLLLSFGLLCQRRAGAMIGLYAWQAGVLAAAAAWQGWVQDAPELAVTAAVTLAAKAVAIPTLLRRFAGRLAPGPRNQAGRDAGPGVSASMAAGVAVVALAILVVPPTTPPQAALNHESLALAMSVVLLGVLVMITRRSALGQAVGFLSMENGLVLAAVGAAGMPLVVELSVAALALAVVAAFVFRVRGHLDRPLRGRD